MHSIRIQQVLNSKKIREKHNAFLLINFIVVVINNKLNICLIVKYVD